MNGNPDWRTMALAAIREGLCPNHRTPLGTAGWCSECGHHGVWWSVKPDGQTVVTRYAPMTDTPRPRRQEV